MRAVSPCEVVGQRLSDEIGFESVNEAGEHIPGCENRMDDGPTQKLDVSRNSFGMSCRKGTAERA
jgi:hypothetical protein